MLHGDLKTLTDVGAVVLILLFIFTITFYYWQ